MYSVPNTTNREARKPLDNNEVTLRRDNRQM